MYAWMLCLFEFVYLNKQCVYSIGYCLVLVWGLGRVPRKVQLGVVVVLVGFMSAKSIARNAEWHSNYRYGCLR